MEQPPGRILLVVQDEFLGQSLTDYLAEEGYSICIGANLESVDSGCYDAVVASLSAVTGSDSPGDRLVLCSRTSVNSDLQRDWNVFGEPISFPAVVASLGATPIH